MRGWIWLFPALWLATAAVCIDLQGQRDRALDDARALRTELSEARAQVDLYQRAAKVSQDQAQRLADSAPPPCPPCPTLGDRIRTLWEGQ